MVYFQHKHVFNSYYLIWMGEELSNKYVGIWYCSIFPVSQLLTPSHYFWQDRILSKNFYFFSDYLISRRTQYMWNNFFSPFFEVNIGIGQGSALSPVLSLLFYTFEKQIQNLKILVSFWSFVDDGLLISQEKSVEKTNYFLFYSYNIISSLLDQFKLVIKTEVFHFSRCHGAFNPPHWIFWLLEIQYYLQRLCGNISSSYLIEKFINILTSTKTRHYSWSKAWRC